jgi:hypothetical protein
VSHAHAPRQPGEASSRPSELGNLEDPVPDKCDDQPWQRVRRLGTKTIKGLAVEGKRYTICVPAHTDKDDQARISVSESWDAEGLDVPVLQIDNDPFIETVTTEMVDIEFGEPDPALFQIPAGYTIRDQ